MRARYVNVSRKTRTALVAGKLYEFPPWDESPGLELDEDHVKLVERRHLIPGSKWKRIEADVYDTSTRFLVKMQPGLIDALSARDKTRPSYLDIAPASEQPSPKWQRTAIMQWLTEHGIAYNANWSSERLLRLAIEGPNDEDRADIAAAKAAREAAKAEAEAEFSKGPRPAMDAPGPIDPVLAAGEPPAEGDEPDADAEEAPDEGAAPEGDASTAKGKDRKFFGRKRG